MTAKSKVKVKVKGPPLKAAGPPSQVLNRKDKRKAERKLKKARKDAFAHRKFDKMKDLRDIDTEYKIQAEEQEKVDLKIKKKQKKNKKKKEKRAVEKNKVEQLRHEIKEDDMELKQLEKRLKMNKKKGKSGLPQAFMDDGLDYLLDATESDKIQGFDDIAPGMPILGESDSEFEEEEEDSVEYDTTDFTQKWDPDSKAGKSILKSDKKKDSKKSVKFSEAEGEVEESESVCAEDSFDDESLEFMDDENEDDFGVDFDDDNENDEDLGGDIGGASEEEEVDDLSKGGEAEEKQVTVVKDPIPSKKRKRLPEDTGELKEDIYGRLRDKQGNVVSGATVGSYVPPAKRAMMSGSQPNEALRKKLKGLVNKVSEGSIQFISNQVESLYLEHSRADVNETLASLIMESVIAPILTPERLVAESAMLVAILHSNVGSEVGAFFLQKLAVRFKELSDLPDYGLGKTMDNVLMLLANLYNFKIVSSSLIIDLMQRLISKFGLRDIELLLLLFKTLGFTLRRDDPGQLKIIIMDIQTKARETDLSAAEGSESRMKFMLEILSALRNNNMRKIPGYDPTHLEHLRKLIKSFLRGQMLGDNMLTMGLEDLLKADQCGRWWIVGSAWDGRQAAKDDKKGSETKTEVKEVSGVSKKMLKLAKQQGMNTEVRRHIFCILGTSEDFEDAFARLLRLGLNRSQEREIIHVLFHCCLNEKTYNPFYAFLAEKFCTFDRRFTVTVQFTVWDKFKEVDAMGKEWRNKLGCFISHLLISKALSLSVFKVVEFGMESKKMIRLLVQVLGELLSSANLVTVKEIFGRIAPFPKLKPLCQGLQVFMRVHLKGTVIKGMTSTTLQEHIEKVESAMFSNQSMML